MIVTRMKNLVDTGHDLFCVTVDPEVFKYTLSFAHKFDVIKCMLEYADGPEHMETIIELLETHDLKLPKYIIDNTFTNEHLKWCGRENYDEFRKKITANIK